MGTVTSVDEALPLHIPTDCIASSSKLIFRSTAFASAHTYGLHPIDESILSAYERFASAHTYGLHHRKCNNIYERGMLCLCTYLRTASEEWR